jgi:Putative beta barrel porin-7 (BBP7)
MKSYVGLEYDRDGAGGTYAYRPVNDYYDYQMPIIDPSTAPIPAGSAGYVRVMAQRVRTDFRAENLELNLIRFPVCGCATGCSGGGCGGGGCDACGCNSNYTGCNSCGCEDSCGCGFSMYGSCGVRWFRLDDEFLYGSESQVYDGSAYGPSSWLTHNIDVENNLVGPQIGWTSDYCCNRWNFFLNSTFGIFDNHINVWNRMRDDSGNWARYSQDGSTFNVRSNKDNVAFLGELRVGTAYDFTCHWRGVIAYRAVAMTGIATAEEQLQNSYTDRWTTSIIDSTNSVVIHGAQVGVECRY